MTYEGFTDDFEERADRILEATLALSEVEIDEIYSAAHPNEDSRERAYQLAKRAKEVCEAEHRELPEQLREALAQLGQIALPLERKPTAPVPPCVLLIDQNPDRLMARRKLFEKKQINTVVTTSAAEGLIRLRAEAFRLVIVDFVASTEEDHADLVSLQEFNLTVPVINLTAWAGAMNLEFKRFNHDLLRVASRLCRKKVPEAYRENGRLVKRRR